MTEDTLVPFDLPAVKRKKMTADLVGGLVSSDSGSTLLRDQNAGSAWPRRRLIVCPAL